MRFFSFFFANLTYVQVVSHVVFLLKPIPSLTQRNSIMGLQKQYLKVGQSAKNRLFGIQPNTPVRKSTSGRSRNADTRPLQMMVSDQNKISNSKWFLPFFQTDITRSIWLVIHVWLMLLYIDNTDRKVDALPHTLNTMDHKFSLH